jgi:L-ascorbate metabolism protein UlaG (beta-lactamase superfamily)
VEITLLRHATLLVRLNGKTLLVDPMFDPPGARPPVENTPNDRRNPLGPLPDFDPCSVEAILVTHTHADHLDATAVERLPRDLPLFCQPEDEGGLRSRGFSDVRRVGEGVSWDGVEVFRTGGRHGTGEIGAKLAPVSGFVLRVPDEPALYVAGDTVWCPEVEAALDEHEPRVVVVNAGAARFNVGDPITMTAQDVAGSAATLPRPPSSPSTWRPSTTASLLETNFAHTWKARTSRSKPSSRATASGLAFRDPCGPCPGAREASWHKARTRRGRRAGGRARRSRP